MSSFDGDDLFGSGPHRFAQGASGAHVVESQRLDPSLPGSFANGVLETKVFVRGRLVANTESVLRTRVQDVLDVLTDPPTSGVLADGNGRTWSGMSFVRFEPADRVDRGGRVSVAYTAEFRRFL